MKKIGFLFLITVFLTILYIGTVFAAEEEIIDPQIPDSWFEAPKTASEMDITNFNQSPILDEKVEEGILPPVEERLPVDPPVIEPYGDIGEYGGTANVWSDSLHSGHDAAFVGNLNSTAGQPTPDGKKMVPFYVKDWEYSNDYKEMTLELREGVKYSDGTSFTADDYLFWWEHYANNDTLQPVSPENWKPVPYLDVVKEGEYTVKFVFGRPNPRIHDFSFQGNMGPGVNAVPPGEYMKQFHPDYIGEEKVKEMAQKVDLENWDDFYGRIRDDSPDHPEYEYQRPVLNPYIAVERSETTLILERNPYYPFVDPEGNQLPYIDKIKINLANSSEMVSTKAATGEATLSARHTRTRDIPLYKRNEEKANFKTHIFKRAYGMEVAIHPNLTHKDPDIREVFQDLNFRKALSLAIDREEINNKVYFGRAQPRQNNVHPLNQFYKEEYGQAYADYAPEKAKTLLDEMGMKDVNGDGYRERPDGEEFNPTLLYCKMGAVNPGSTLELLKGNWEEVGINVTLKMVSRELHDQRCAANDMDMTVWTGGLTLDIGFGNTFDIGRTFAPTGAQYYNSWPGWTNWYLSDGEEGMEPPEEIKDLIKLGEQLAYETDEKLRNESGEKLVRAQAENLWSIGTVGSGPQPIIVNEKLNNVPEKGLWAWATRYMKPFYSIQFYLEE